MVWWTAAVCAFFIKGLCGFANTLVFTTILSFAVDNASISPVELLLGYPSNLILLWRERRFLRWKLCLPLSALVPHADEGVVPHGAAVDNGVVADGAADAHTGLLVEDGAVLDVGALAYGDGSLVSPEDGVVPDVYALSKGHVAADLCAVADQHVGGGLSQFALHGDFLVSLCDFPGG